MTYDLERVDIRPTLEVLRVMMAPAIVSDEIILPDYVSRDRSHCAAICQKVNQSIQVFWRQKLADGTQPKISEDQGLPTITAYGAKAELRLRDIDRIECGVEWIVRAPYREDMTVLTIPSTQWAYINK
jgi:hypothetical protein